MVLLRLVTSLPNTMALSSPTEQVVLAEGNTRGFSVLPDELLLEIISHFQLPPTPSAWRPSGFKTRDRFHRREALIALSSTSHNLRRVFHPYIWERIEVVSGMMIGGRILDRDELKSTKQALYKELLRQLTVVTTLDPTLSKRVRYHKAHFHPNFSSLKCSS